MEATPIKTANALVILGHDDCQMWRDIAPLLELIPEDKREMARAIRKEGQLTSTFIIDAGMDATNAAFRQLAGGAVLRRQGWLKSTAFRPEVQSKILDMPFDGLTLFSKHVDDAL